MHIRTTDPPTPQVQIFLYPMPYLWIQLAAREKINSAARLHRNIGDDKTRMMGWEHIVDGVGQDPELVVEEVDCDDAE